MFVPFSIPFTWRLIRKGDLGLQNLSHRLTWARDRKEFSVPSKYFFPAAQKKIWNEDIRQMALTVELLASIEWRKSHENRNYLLFFLRILKRKNLIFNWKLVREFPAWSQQLLPVDFLWWKMDQKLFWPYIVNGIWLAVVRTRPTTMYNYRSVNNSELTFYKKNVGC